MTHYTILVLYRGWLKEVEGKIAQMLAPYDENLDGPARIEVPVKKAKTEFKKVMKEPKTSNKPHMKEYKDNPKMKYEEWAKTWYGEQKVDKKGNILTTYNQDSKWDWYSIGGRWHGSLILKAGAKGTVGKPGIFGPTGEPGVEAPYREEIVGEAMDKRDGQPFTPCAVLDERGWLAAGKMGWWG